MADLLQEHVPPEQIDIPMDTNDHAVVQTAESIFHKMFLIIPQEVIPVWRELGDEIGLSDQELDLIEADAPKKVNKTCALEMLKKWRAQYNNAATPSRLIAALEHDTIKQNRYAAQLRQAVDNNTFDQDYKDRKIAEDIAPYWKSVGIQLDVKHLDGITATNSPTIHKFQGMLLKWLGQQMTSERDIYVKFHKALVDMEKNRAAEEFSKKAFKSNNDGDDDKDPEVPN